MANIVKVYENVDIIWTRDNNNNIAFVGIPVNINPLNELKSHHPVEIMGHKCTKLWIDPVVKAFMNNHVNDYYTNVGAHIEISSGYPLLKRIIFNKRKK